MKTWWDGLPRRDRAVLGIGGVLAALLLAFGGWWAVRTEQAVLFADLRPQDAAAMTEELDKLKVRYEVADNGSTLLVEKSQVHAIRLKLMGKDIPLHGSVGLELFNNTDFGMTEFAQKINFQRALQGELTRTILAFPEIRDVRVHLALPEQGLFRQNATRPKAAITVHLRHGQGLRAEQVAGIQRLVAAAVPGLAAQEVTIVDHQGVALSRTSEADANGAAVGARLDLKRETEAYLVRKATTVLEQAFGHGQALASVDVTLDMDQVRVTTEDVVGAPDGKGGAATGVLVRERESARDNAAPDSRNPEFRAARGSSMQRDVEYQTGKRVEHVVGQPGAIRRIQVVALVRRDLAAPEREQMQRVLAAAVGASLDRGDAVVVQTFQPAAVHTAFAAPAAADAAAPPVAPTWQQSGVWIALLLLAALVVVLARRSPWRVGRPAPARALTEAQRQATLQAVQGWMIEALPSSDTSHARSPR